MCCTVRQSVALWTQVKRGKKKQDSLQRTCRCRCTSQIWTQFIHSGVYEPTESDSESTSCSHREQGGRRMTCCKQNPTSVPWIDVLWFLDSLPVGKRKEDSYIWWWCSWCLFMSVWEHLLICWCSDEILPVRQVRSSSQPPLGCVDI